VLNDLGMSEGSILNVLRTGGFGILNLFHLGESFFQKCPQTGWKINFDRDQTIGRVRPNNWL
jgi:hypothetical protein